MPSIRSKVLSELVRAIPNQDILDEDRAKIHIDRQSDCPLPPQSIEDDMEVERFKINGRNIFNLFPRGNNTPKAILYIHGGAYVHGIQSAHWQYVSMLAQKYGYHVIIPDYPLAPESTFKESYAVLDHLYDSMLKQYEPANLVLMGDSAGGGFALAFSQKLTIERKPQPSQLILLSPWLDISMVNPELYAFEIENKDPFLKIDDLKIQGKLYAGDTDVRDYRLSPMYGPIDGLPQISIFSGTNDLLNPDARRFHRQCMEKGVEINFYEYEEMIHGWMLITFLPEAKKANRQVGELLET